MIFCTIGTQIPFDRFIKIVDEVATQIDEEIIAQVSTGEYQAKNIKTVSFLAPDEFEKIFKQARVIVAHAGMGTIISAMRYEKPIIIFPRIAALGEHRNEHQLATTKQMSEMGYVYTANDAPSLLKLLSQPILKPLHKLGNYADQSLVDELCRVIG
jgi:UDP-N-acetylglucosamine transferase subunit ALG13